MRKFVQRSSLGPFGRLGSLTLVGGLHALLAAFVVVASGLREVVPAPAPVQVRLLAEPSPRRPEPPLQPVPLPKLAAPPPVVAPVPEVPDSPPQPQPTITAMNAAPTEPTSAAPVGPLLAEGSATARQDSAPVLIEQVAYARFEPPPYPALSRRLGEQGLVVLRVLIDEEGRPADVHVHRSSGYARLDQAAVEAIRRARFRPYREGERVRAAIALVPVRFELT